MRLMLSQSRLNKYEKCPRSYYYNYIINFKGEQIVSLPMKFGLLVHSLMEDIYKLAEKNEDMDRAEIVKNLVFQKIVDIEGTDLADCEGRLSKLIKPISSLVNKYDMIEAERWIDVELFEEGEFSEEIIETIVRILDRFDKEGMLKGIFFGGYIDAFARDKDGNALTLDWKTGRHSKKWAPPYIRQIQLYVELFNRIGIGIDKGKLVYVEHRMEHDVDVDEKTCRATFNEMKEAFRKIILLGDDINNFPMIEDEPISCNDCNYDLICHNL